MSFIHYKYQGSGEKKQTTRFSIMAWVLVGIIALLCCLSLVGCKAHTLYIGSTQSQARDSMRTERRIDSVFIERWHKEVIKGDTCYIHDSIDRWRTREIHDSIFCHTRDTIYQPVEIVKEQSAFLRNSGIALWVIITMAIVAAGIGIIIKFAK